MSEYVFRDAPGYGCADDATMEDGRTSAREYYSQENSDHYGTLHERIVRCRDCVGLVETWNGWECERFSGQYHMAYPNGFCAWGERRDSIE